MPTSFVRRPEVRAATIGALLRADAKIVRRDAYLLGAIAIPVLTALLLRFGYPPLAAWLLEEWALDLEPYAPLLVAYLVVLMTPFAIGTVGGFMLLEERDERTLDALRVTPLPFARFLAYRGTLTALLSFVLLPICVHLTGIAPLAVAPLLATSFLAALVAPAVMLFFAIFAANKVHGVGLQKLLGALFLLPIAAYFVPEPWSAVIGVAFPPTWAARAYWSHAQGTVGVGYALAAGLVTVSVLVALLYASFGERPRVSRPIP
ncbi:MAG: hypothetical protein H0U69_00755 [Trueperaceae bacterium]|nr:hypothetical protein [Trueperaceae bacterium]